MKSFGILYAGILLSAISILSCTKNDPLPDPTAGLTQLATGYVPGAATRIELYSDKSEIQTGYNNMFVIMYDSVTNQYVDEGHIHLKPMMDMGTMKHSAPFENPVSETAVNHLFPCGVVFIMPSTGGQWTLTLQVHNHRTDKSGQITLPISVSAPAKPNMISFKNIDDGLSYFAALVQPSKPKIGINDFEFVIFKKETMMNFPADSSYNIAIEPEMPTMGHGSPNNVNPTHLKEGHYKGKVNFTMTGFWRIHVNFQRTGKVIDSTKYFDLEF